MGVKSASERMVIPRPPAPQQANRWPQLISLVTICLSWRIESVWSIDNFLSEEEFKTFLETVLHGDFPWHRGIKVTNSIVAENYQYM